MLLPYQKAWIEDESQFKIALFARQTGKTFTTTLEITLSCLAAELEGKKERWVILSRGERQAKEAMDEGVKLHCRALDIAIRSRESQGESLGIKHTVLETIFPGGSKITALPANPDTARGFSANVFLDEFAFHADSHKIWAALFPVISAGHKIRVTSTPNGKNNKFYDLMTDPAVAGIWSRHRVDIHQAVADGLPRDIDLLRAGLADDDAWRAEYELDWMDEASAWLSFDLILAAEHPEAGYPGKYQGNPCFVGVDIGRKNDLFVIWVLEAVGDVLWTREVIAKQRIPFAEQDHLLDRVFKQYRVIKCCVDETGIGQKPVEDAQRRHGQNIVEGVNFTIHSKMMLAQIGKQAFEASKIRIPAGDSDLVDDLHSLQKTTTATGAIRFDAERTTTGHADRAWACFLACYAAATKPIGHITSASPRKAKDLLTGYDE